MLEVGPGDEVIVPAMTYTASCSVITHVGATPVMVDIQEDTFEMDYDKLEQAITEKTKVIIPVELAGIICDYERLFQVVEKKRDLFVASSKWQKAFNRIVIVSDSAHALGSTYKGQPAGSIADFTSSHSMLLRTLQQLRVEVRLGKPIQRLMTKKCTRNSKSFPFMVKLRMLLLRCNWVRGNTILSHQPTSAI